MLVAIVAFTPLHTPPLSLVTFSTAGSATIPSGKESASDSTPVVAGVASAAAGTALIALAVLLKRQRDSKLKVTHRPSVLPVHDDDDHHLEQGRGQLLDGVRPPAPAVLVAGTGGGKSSSRRQTASLHRQSPAEDDGRVSWKSIPASLAGPMESCTGHATDAVEDESRSCRHSTSLCRLAPEEAGEAGGDDANPKLPLPPLADPARSSIRNAANAAENGGVRHAGEDAADGSPERLTTATAPTATATSANVSTHEQEELARFHQRKGVAGTPPVASGPNRRTLRRQQTRSR